MVYQFNNPGKIRIRQRTPDQPAFMDISGEVWQTIDGGIKFRINWNKLPIIHPVKEFLKGYLAHRLSKQSVHGTFSNDVSLIKKLSKSPLAGHFPWSKIDLLTFIGSFSQKNEASRIYSFNSLYRWCTEQTIEGFSSEILLSLSEHKIKPKKPYEKVFLSQVYLTNEQEHLILGAINEPFNRSRYYKVLDNAILQLCYELAPRPIQLYMLDVSDFNAITSPAGEIYYSLNLPMAKKRSNDKIEKRPRQISKQLGEKISQLLEAAIDKSPCSPLFKLNPNSNGRISSRVFSDTISLQLQLLGIYSDKSATLLRHHLAQSLADQGASAETIAEILGHNSTLPARAYITATPKIAEIKTRALGKNGTYLNIMKMLVTGEIIDRDNASKERFVQGMVGSQYIGGIGTCGLPENTACPKNPVYACYTCHKFHPFRDGAHEVVKLQLQSQVQLFVDVAEKSRQLGNNRAVLQLEKTIEAVDNVIERIEQLKSNKNQ